MKTDFDTLRRRLALASGRGARAYRLLQMFAVYRRPIVPIVNRLLPAQDRGSVLYSLRGGLQLEVDPGWHDVRVINEVWGDRIYELKQQFCPRPSWVVVDVGAHKGIFSARAASLIRQGALFSIEPAPHNYGFLVRNVPSSQGLDFTPVNAAVAANPGRGLLNLRGGASGLNSLYDSRFNGQRSEEAVEVDLIALTDVMQMVQRQVDLLKLDVEGAEYEIILDSPREAWDQVRRLVAEYDQVDPRNGITPVSALVDRLSAHGFQVSLTPERRLLWAVRED
jgi:FkbM family methyltransferase